MKLKGKDFYKKMLDAKKAKQDKVKKSKKTLEEETPEVRPELPDTPKQRIEVTEPAKASPMEERTSTASALERALQRIEQQARGL